MKKEATFTVSPGEVIDLIEAWVAEQANWEEYDTYGTEKAVFKCTGGNTNFYLYVDDDTAGYAEVKLWEEWNNVTHAGSGNSTTTQYIVKYAANWRIVGDTDHLILYMTDGTNYARGMYCGYTTPVLPSDTKAILLVAAYSNSSTTGYVSPYNYAYGYWLFGYPAGAEQKTFFYHPTVPNDMAIATGGENVVLFHPYVGIQPQANRARGIQKSVFGDGTSVIDGFTVNDTIYLNEMPYVCRAVYNGYCWIKNG